MSSARLSRPNQTWALAYAAAFADPTHPTTAELNDRRFVHLISCLVTEDGTSLVLGDSETDDTMTFCSVGNESTPTDYNVTGQVTWLRDANTGGSGSTVDLTSKYNHVTALLDAPDIPYWLISRTGPNLAQDINFAVGHRIKMASFLTDYPADTLENKTPIRGVNSLVFQGDVLWNYTVAA
jgi:hypothetical protein